MVTVNIADFKQSPPWKCGPSWVVPAHRKMQVYPFGSIDWSTLTMLHPSWYSIHFILNWYKVHFTSCNFKQIDQLVPREWTGSKHMNTLLPCLTGITMALEWNQSSHQNWTWLRTVPDSLDWDTGTFNSGIDHQKYWGKNKKSFLVLPWTFSSPPLSGSVRVRTWTWCRWTLGQSSQEHDGWSGQAETMDKNKNLFKYEVMSPS